jgi:hypothetical protein
MPARLLIASARQALRTPPRATGETAPARIAILTDDSSTLRTRLLACGFDYFVRRPVHPVALRLLMLRLLYRGEERRGSARVPMGCTVQVRRLLGWRDAVLADLSPRGARLLVPRAARPDSRLTLRLPGGVTQGRELTLEGWIVRCERDPHADPKLPFVAAMVFDLLPAAADQRLRTLLTRAALGPFPLEAPVEPAAPDERPTALGLPGPRSRLRRTLRRPFSWRVVAIEQHDRAMRVLVGRDLSTSGMLVEPHPGLHRGDRVSIAFYGSAEQRLVVDAEVVRESPDGLALRFLNAGPELAARLEAVMAENAMRKSAAPLHDPVSCVVTEIASVARVGATWRAEPGVEAVRGAL